MKKLLVTGGAGFIGSNFVRKYSDEYAIYVLDKMTYAGNAENLSGIPRFNFYKADICNYDACNVIFTAEKFDAVINFAAETHVDNSIESPRVFTETNVLGTQVLLDLALKHNVDKFVQISTDEVYGHLHLEEPKFTEKTPLNPRSPYSATKASADMIALSYANTYGLDVSITRCSNNYGKNQNAEKLIPTIVRKALNNEEIPIYGKGENIRDWIYVDDHCAGVNLVLNKGNAGEVYNFGGNNEITNIDLCKLILKYMNKPESLISYVKDRPGHDFRYAINYSKAELDLGWSPSVNFHTMLPNVINSEIDKIKQK
jgi:dTDP-glucose 4,6-dehydratase